MPDTANRASSSATARSQLATSWQPAAVAILLPALRRGRLLSAIQPVRELLLPARELLEFVADLIELLLQTGQQFSGQRVVLCRPVERQRCDAAMVTAQENGLGRSCVGVCTHRLRPCFVGQAG